MDEFGSKKVNVKTGKDVGESEYDEHEDQTSNMKNITAKSNQMFDEFIDSVISNVGSQNLSKSKFFTDSRAS